MRSLLVIIPLAAVMSGCYIPSDQEIARDRKYGVEAQACAAMRVAIQEDLRTDAYPGFGQCNLKSDDNRKFWIGMEINVPYVDQEGKRWPTTLYYANAKLDPATGAMRATGLVKDLCLSGCK